ncbi:MAG: glycosyltransferase family 39 protein [Armatimonadetes bacterium]|nr:glycosyltransferase family 39 protein [Armatimonadota bacterium]
MKQINSDVASIMSPDSLFGHYSTLPRWVWITVWALIAGLLGMMITYVWSPDTAVFYLLGKQLLEGKVMFRDFIDNKPPLIAWIYAGGIFLFGSQSYSIRILDCIVQIITCGVMISLVRRATGNSLWAVTSALLYAILYSGLGFMNSAQTESYAGICAVSALWFQLHKRTGWGLFTAGFLLGALFTLKYPMGIMLAIAVVAEFWFFRDTAQKMMQRALFLIAGFLIVPLLLVAWLASSGAWANFLEASAFMSKYGTIQWQNPALLIKNYLSGVPSYFGDDYSMLLVFSTAIGMFLAIQSGESVRQTTGQTLPKNLNNSNHGFTGSILLRVATLGFLGMVLTVLIEGKMADYHFSRIFSFGAILAGAGVLSLLSLIRYALKKDLFGKIIALVAACLLIVYSPLSRMFRNTIAVYFQTVQGKTYWGYEPVVAGQYLELQSIDSLIDASGTPQDTLYASSLSTGLAYAVTNRMPPFKFTYSMFFCADFAPYHWKQETANYLRASVPKWILTEQNDESPVMTGNNFSSEQGLRRLPGVDSLLNTRYQVVLSTPVAQFILFKRIDPNGNP